MSKKLSVFFVGLIMLMLALVVYAGSAGATDSPANPASPIVHADTLGQTDLSCTQCHNDTSLITGKETAWSESAHGMGTTYLRGTSAGCAGCHSGAAFSERIAAGLAPDEVEAGDPNPTRQDCRACHNIHTTYTSEDWSLESTDPVDLYAFEGVTFDGGKGDLCANCHQPRRAMGAEDGMVNVDSTHWGPHHAPQAATLLGMGGAGVEGNPSPHTMVPDTCVTCHLYNDNHSFEPNVAACQMCHSDAENFDIEGVQTHVDELVAELEEALIAKGMLTEEGEPVVGEYPEAEGAALWNYIYVAHEDKSHGVHHPDYVIALLEASIEALQ
jgi:hypothetical protein